MRAQNRYPNLKETFQSVMYRPFLESACKVVYGTLIRCMCGCIYGCVDGSMGKWVKPVLLYVRLHSMDGLVDGWLGEEVSESNEPIGSNDSNLYLCMRLQVERMGSAL